MELNNKSITCFIEHEIAINIILYLFSFKKVPEIIFHFKVKYKCVVRH